MRGKGNRTPAQKEYDRAYSRLKTRKQRGKISTDEWNAAVAADQDLVARSERGELTDEELKRRLVELCEGCRLRGSLFFVDTGAIHNRQLIWRNSKKE